MTIPPKSLMIGTCEIASHYPELSLIDAAGDALQLAEKIRLCGIEEPQKEEAVFIAACRFVSADKELMPQKAVEKALRIWDILETWRESNLEKQKIDGSALFHTESSVDKIK